MQTTIEILRSIGVFSGGVLARFGLFLAMVSIFFVPAIVIALGIRGASRRRERALGLRDVAGVPYRPDLAYAPGHLWLHARGGGRAHELGLDGLAQRLLTGVSAVESIRPGTRVSRGETIATLHGGGRALAVPAPFDGTVLGVNAAVVRDPQLVKREPFGRGWLVAIAPDDGAEGRLARGAEAEEWTRREAHRWNAFLEQRLGFASADGGSLLAPAPWLVGEDGWRELSAAFLKP